MVTLVEGFFGFATKNILLAACKAGWMDGRSFSVKLAGRAGSRTSMGTLMQCVSKHSSCFSLQQNTKGIFNTSRKFKIKINLGCNGKSFCKIWIIISNICCGKGKLLKNTLIFLQKANIWLVVFTSILWLFFQKFPRFPSPPTEETL